MKKMLHDAFFLFCGIAAKWCFFAHSCMHEGSCGTAATSRLHQRCTLIHLTYVMIKTALGLYQSTFLSCVVATAIVHAALPHKIASLRLCRKTKTEQRCILIRLYYNLDVLKISGRWREQVERSALALKLLCFELTGQFFLPYS